MYTYISCFSFEQNKVTAFIKNAADLILNQTKEASSKDIEEASEELFGTAVNVIKTESSKSKQVRFTTTITTTTIHVIIHSYTTIHYSLQYSFPPV